MDPGWGIGARFNSCCIGLIHIMVYFPIDSHCKFCTQIHLFFPLLFIRSPPKLQDKLLTCPGSGSNGFWSENRFLKIWSKTTWNWIYSLYLMYPVILEVIWWLEVGKISVFMCRIYNGSLSENKPWYDLNQCSMN